MKCNINTTFFGGEKSDKASDKMIQKLELRSCTHTKIENHWIWYPQYACKQLKYFDVLTDIVYIKDELQHTPDADEILPINNKNQEDFLRCRKTVKAVVILHFVHTVWPLFQMLRGHATLNENYNISEVILADCNPYPFLHIHNCWSKNYAFYTGFLY